MKGHYFVIILNDSMEFIFYIIAFSLLPIFQKIGMEIVSHIELFVMTYFITTILLLLYIAFYDVKIDMRRMFNKNIIIVALLLFAGNIMYLRLLKNNASSWLVLSYPLLIVVTLIFSYYILNEQITGTQLIGLIVVLVGLGIFYHKDIQKLLHH